MFYFFLNYLLVINFQLFFLPEGVSFVLKLVVLWSVAFLLLQKLKRKKLLRVGVAVRDRSSHFLPPGSLEMLSIK